MSIRLPMTITSIQSNQSLIDDTVSYSLCGSILGESIVLPVNISTIKKIDSLLKGDNLVQPNEAAIVPEIIPQESPMGYDFGIMYGENDHE